MCRKANFLSRTTSKAFVGLLHLKHRECRNVEFLTKTMDQSLSKNAIFSTFLIRSFYSLERHERLSLGLFDVKNREWIFCLLERLTSRPSCLACSLAKSGKICIFSGGLVHGFGQKFAIFAFSVFQIKQGNQKDVSVKGQSLDKQSKFRSTLFLRVLIQRDGNLALAFVADVTQV